MRRPLARITGSVSVWCAPARGITPPFTATTRRPHLILRPLTPCTVLLPTRLHTNLQVSSVLDPLKPGLRNSQAAAAPLPAKLPSPRAVEAQVRHRLRTPPQRTPCCLQTMMNSYATHPLHMTIEHRHQCHSFFLHSPARLVHFPSRP